MYNSYECLSLEKIIYFQQKKCVGLQNQQRLRHHRNHHPDQRDNRVDFAGFRVMFFFCEIGRTE